MGVLLGDAFIHLIPDAVNRHGSVAEVCLMTLVGIFCFFVLEKIVRWRHDHRLDFADQPDDIRPMAKMNLVGDAIHNFVDGILIGVSFLVDPAIGVTTTFAIIAHEIPQEIGDVGALVYGGYSPKQAVLFNFLLFVNRCCGRNLYLIAEPDRQIVPAVFAADCRWRLYLYCCHRHDSGAARTFDHTQLNRAIHHFCVRYRILCSRLSYWNNFLLKP